MRRVSQTELKAIRATRHNKPTYFTVVELRFAVGEEEHDVGAALRLARGRREVFKEREGFV